MEGFEGIDEVLLKAVEEAFSFKEATGIQRACINKLVVEGGVCGS